MKPMRFRYTKVRKLILNFFAEPSDISYLKSVKAYFHFWISA